MNERFDPFAPAILMAEFSGDPRQLVAAVRRLSGLPPQPESKSPITKSDRITHCQTSKTQPK